MNKIQVEVLQGPATKPGGMMTFLAKLTQRGHNIKDMNDLKKLYNDTIEKHSAAEYIVKMPHGTIKRFTPITVAIVGASRRFLAQIRTHHVGVTFVSASLQYSDYSGQADFVVPYEYIKNGKEAVDRYINKCKSDLKFYEDQILAGYSNDTAGYSMNQGLRNIVIATANHEAWMNIIRLRACNRNTDETQYVVLKIWEALYNSEEGSTMFKYAGPDCVHYKCLEGKMSCGDSLKYLQDVEGNPATYLLKQKWPLLYK